MNLLKVSAIATLLILVSSSLTHSSGEGPWECLWGDDCTGGGGGGLSVTEGEGVDLGGVTATECVMLSGGAINCSAAPNDCSVDDVAGTNFDYTVATFTNSGATDEIGAWSFNLPDNLTGTTAAVTVFWSSADDLCNGGAGDDVCFVIDSGSAGVTELWETATMGASVGETDKCLDRNDLHVIALPTLTHSMTAGERGYVRLARDANGSSAHCTPGEDDYSGNAQVLAVKFCYEVDNVFSGENP
jgi:hypothetical protein